MTPGVTRLLYATTGAILRKITSNSNDSSFTTEKKSDHGQYLNTNEREELHPFSAYLSEVTHIVIDEVHERGVETDFLMNILKQELPNHPHLKVVSCNPYYPN
jgi:hypothetical protein